MSFLLQDLTFTKGEKIRVVSLAPKDEAEEEDDDDDEWFIGESLDGSRKGTFPGGFVTISDEVELEEQEQPETADAAVVIPVTSEAIKSAKDEVEEEQAQKEVSGNQVDGAIAPPTSQQDVETPATTQEKTGFGAPLPVRPKPDDEDEYMEMEKGKESMKETSKLVEPSQPAPPQAAQSVTSPVIPAATSTPSAAPSRSATLSPPPQVSSKPVAPSKPNSLKDRIAAFNKPAEAGGGPPPLPKSKPGGWKRPAPAPGAPKPLLPGSKPVTSPTPPHASLAATAPAVSQPPALEPLNTSTEETPKDGVTSSGSGFSAADAKSSIKMSLKERMAALQRGDPAPGTGSGDDSAEPRSPPTVPGRIAREKRDVAMTGMGLGAGEAGLARRLSNASAGGGPEETPSKLSMDLESSRPTDDAPTSTSETKEESPDSKVELSQEDEGAVASQLDQEVGEQPELTEEEQETARRAAIAERLAKLGGRRMGGGPLFGGPPPIKPKPQAQASMDTVGSAESSASIDAPAMPIPSASEETAGEMADSNKPATLAVPRRAGPPRRKKSSATPPIVSPQAETTSPQEEVPSEQVEDVQVGDSALVAPVGDEETLLNEEEAEQHRASQDETELEPVADAAKEPAAAEIASPTQEEGTDEEENEEDTEAPAAIPPRPTSIPPRPPSTGSLPSRPGSVRPPVPRSTLPLLPADTEEGDDDLSNQEAASLIATSTSPAPQRQLPTPTPAGRPPIPKSPPPPSIGEDRDEDLGGRARQPSLGTAASMASGAITAPPALAAPRAIHAVPTKDFEEEVEHAPEDQVEGDLEPQIQGQAESQPEAEEEEEAPELTEEEQETQRRQAIARRMAALSGGQRMAGMPGMQAFGAPMPVKKKTAPVPVETDDSPEGAEREAAEVGIPASQRVSSPPPTSPPAAAAPTESLGKRASMQSVRSIASPPPLPPGRRSQASEDDRPGDAESLSRRASFRPPIPKSREPSTASNLVSEGIDEEEDQGARVSEIQTSRDGGGGEDEDENAYATAIANQFTPTEELLPQSPPALPTSRVAASRASVDRSLPPTPQANQQPPTSGNNLQQSDLQAPISSNFSQKSASSRDLDLMPSSKWWRQGLNPLRLPPTISARPDSICYVDTATQTKRGRTTHTAEIHVLFEDLSQTVVELSFEDDDAEERATVLNQRHYFPPSKPTSEQLSKWSGSIGSLVGE